MYFKKGEKLTAFCTSSYESYSFRDQITQITAQILVATLSAICLPFNTKNGQNTIQSAALFDLILYVPVNNLSVRSGRVFLG